MKHSNWMGICRSFVDDLPHGRAYSKVEAAYSLQWDYFYGKQATISGYADLWLWSRNKVRNFLIELDISIIYPEDTAVKRKQKGTLTLLETDKTEKGHKKRIINSKLELIKDNKKEMRIEKGHKKGHKKDIKGTLNGQEEDNENSKLNDDRDIKRTRDEHKKDNRKDTTVYTREEKEIEKDSVYISRANKVFAFYLKETNPTLITKAGAIQNICYFLKEEKYNTKKLMKAVTNYSSVSGNHKKDPINFFGADTESKNYKYFESYLEENFEPQKKKKRKASNKTKMTLDYILTDKFKNYAIEKGIAAKDISVIFKDFKEYHVEKGESRGNWFLSWNTWIRNYKNKGWGHSFKPKRFANQVPEESRRNPKEYDCNDTTIAI